MGRTTDRAEKCAVMGSKIFRRLVRIAPLVGDQNEEVSQRLWSLDEMSERSRVGEIYVCVCLYCGGNGVHNIISKRGSSLSCTRGFIFSSLTNTFTSVLHRGKQYRPLPEYKWYTTT